MDKSWNDRPSFRQKGTAISPISLQHYGGGEGGGGGDSSNKNCLAEPCVNKSSLENLEYRPELVWETFSKILNFPHF